MSMLLTAAVMCTRSGVGSHCLSAVGGLDQSLTVTDSKRRLENCSANVCVTVLLDDEPILQRAHVGKVVGDPAS